MTPPREFYADTVRYLVIAPRTLRELLELVDACQESMRAWLQVLEDCGMVYVERRGKRSSGAPPMNIYHWCPAPFEKPPTVKHG